MRSLSTGPLFQGVAISSFYDATKPTGKPVDRPPKRGAASTKTLGSVRITEEQLADYDRVAVLKGVTRSDWVTNTLDKAAARVLKKYGDQV